MNHSILLRQTQAKKPGIERKSGRQPSRPKPATPQKPANDLAAKQKAAMEALKQRPKWEILPLNPCKLNLFRKGTNLHLNLNLFQKPVKKPDGREERLAALRAKSALLLLQKKRRTLRNWMRRLERISNQLQHENQKLRLSWKPKSKI